MCLPYIYEGDQKTSNSLSEKEFSLLLTAVTVAKGHHFLVFWAPVSKQYNSMDVEVLEPLKTPVFHDEQ